MIPFFLSTLPSSRSPLLIQFKHLASIDKIIEMRDIRLRSEVSKGLSAPCLSEKESIWVGYTELDHTLQTEPRVTAGLAWWRPLHAKIFDDKHRRSKKGWSGMHKWACPNIFKKGTNVAFFYTNVPLPSYDFDDWELGFILFLFLKTSLQKLCD